MNIADYERVSLNDKIPAMITYLDGTIIDVNSIPIISTHWHRSIEMTLVLEGSLILSVNGEKKTIGAQQFIFVNSGEVHSVEWSGDINTRILIVILSYDFLKKIYPNIDELYFDVQPSNVAHAQLIELFNSLKDYYLQPQEYDYIKVTGLLYELFYLLMKYTQSDFPQASSKRYFKDRERQKNILLFINDNYKDGITLDQVAAKFYMSSEYFSRMFHKYFNITFKDYVNDLRLYHAYEDVINTKDTMQDIAIRNGFYNVKSFISNFKDKYGTTPNRYRSAYNISSNYHEEDKD